GYETVLPHEPRELLRADKVATLPKFTAHARAAVPSLVLGKRGARLRGEARVAAIPLGLGLGEVAVETAARHAHRAAQRGDGKGHPLLGDERVPHALSLAKKVAAAFKISRS